MFIRPAPTPGMILNEKLEWQKGGSRSSGEEMVKLLMDGIVIIPEVNKTRPYARDDS